MVVHDGDLFGGASHQRLPRTVSGLRPPASKFICIWNNFHAAAAKRGLAVPAEPLYLIEGANAYCAHGQPIRVPASYDGRVV